MQPIQPKKNNWKGLWGPWTKKMLAVMFGFYSIVTVIVWFKTKPEGIQWWSLVILFGVLHFLKSFKKINEQMRGVLIFFGLMLEDLDSGPHLVVWPFHIRTETKNSIHVAFGTIDKTNREAIEMSKKAEKSASWYILEEPVRINWGDMKSLGLSKNEMEIYLNDPYANTLTTDPHLYFRIKISSLRTLIEEVGGIQEAIVRIKDTCVRALSEMAGKDFVARARKNLAIMNDELRIRVEDLVGDPQATARGSAKGSPWGLDVEDVGIRDIGAPHAANTALVERAKTIAEADGKATATERTATADAIATEKKGTANANVVKVTADAERHKREQEGAGTAKALKLLRLAEAVGTKALAEASKTDEAKLILKLQALEKAVAAGNVTILPADMSLLTAAVGLKEALGATGLVNPK